MPVQIGKSQIVPCVCCGGFNFNKILNCEDFSFVRCLSCNLVQQNPQPVFDEITTRYSDTFGDDYLSYELDNEAAFLKLQQLALNDAGFYELEKKSAKGQLSVLDVGCATGALLADLRERGWNVIGVEISPCAEYAKNKRKLDVRNVPLEECKFPDTSFDAVLASHLIEHLNNPKSFLNEVCRILKNNGYCFITTPNISGFQARIFGSRWRSAIFDHLYLFSKTTLSKMLKNAGFKIESIHTWGGLAAGIAPVWLKKTADYLVKRLGCGDVMILKTKKAGN
jgi:2-polyprenyl-3-methyl-5-hydroxy-6-metoxy-1,4-benzoquinol methylase